MQEMIKELENKRIVILGFGREGKSTYEFLRKHLGDIVIDVIDENIDILSEDNKEYYEDMNLNVIKTHEYLELLNEYDIIFKSPGISFKGVDISSFESKITSQLEMFLKYTDSLTIGITGTKGKSTTSSLIYSIIREQTGNVHFLGNIGKPIFTEIDEISKNDIVVIEISSHQAQYIKHSPHIGVVLNVFEEHLDHYNSYEEYINSKVNVLRYQTKEDFAIFNANDELLLKHINSANLKSNLIPISIKQKEKYDFFDFNHERGILGEHNAFNIMVALEISKILNLDLKRATNTTYEFKSLPHRLEKVGTFDDVTYYNDSIATIPEAAIMCIETLKNVNTIIIGGMDRGIEYEEFAKYLNECNVENIICVYETGKKILNMLMDENTTKNVKYFDDLKDATFYAKKITKKGKICAMSPAAASYTHFKNFEDRGNKFKEYVMSDM